MSGCTKNILLVGLFVLIQGMSASAFAQPSGMGYGIHGASMPGVGRSGGVSMRNLRVSSAGNRSESEGFFQGSSTHERLLSSLSRMETKLVASSVDQLDQQAASRRTRRKQPVLQKRDASPNRRSWRVGKHTRTKTIVAYREMRKARRGRAASTRSIKSRPWWLASKTPHRRWLASKTTHRRWLASKTAHRHRVRHAR